MAANNKISQITLPDNTTYDLKDSSAIHTGDSIVIGVKGGNEQNYRTGQVNLTASNIGAIASSLKGVSNGVAELDANGLVPTSQLPNYAMSTSVPASSTVSSTGLITFKNNAGTALFTLQLPLYNGSAV